MIGRVGLIFGIGMVAGMCLSMALLAVAVVLLALHSKKLEYYPEDDDEETRFISD